MVMLSRNPSDQYVNDYHGHPNYLMVILALLGFLIVGLVAGPVGASHHTVVYLAFGTAAIKIGLVIMFFMHLYYEPKPLWLLPIVGFAVVFAFFFGVFPDIPMVPHKVETW
jgi:caa(3)-type oxidase subunit IV